ncbi:hypothetical protein [Thiolapillus sp.]
MKDNKSSNGVYWLVLGVVGALIVMLALFFSALLNNYEVLDKGKLLDYTSGFVYKIRFFDSYTVFIEPEHRLEGDVFNSFLMIGIAFISLTYAFLIAQIKRDGVRERSFFMYITLFFGMIFLAADEFFGIHESIGHNMQFLTSLPLVKRPDDFIILSYLIPVVAFLYFFRRELMSNRGTLKAMGGVVGFFLLASVSDLLTLPVEEAAELGASICLVIAILLLGSTHVQQAVRLPVSSN